MLSTKYRLRLEFICGRIAKNAEVELPDMIWAEKLAKANTTAGEMLRKARRTASNPGMPKGIRQFHECNGPGRPRSKQSPYRIQECRRYC